MRAIVLGAMLALLPTFAWADGWVAQLEDDEGGQVMTASVEGDPAAGVTPRLRLLCAGSEGIMLRYEMAAGTASPGSEANLLFENESQQITLPMAYEDMDGAFAAYFPKTDPILGLLENGPDVFISEASGNYPAQSFTLKGSTKAIAKVLKDCKG
ncbi:MAG: hypothetical protein ABI697_11355 [Devosia sp.]